MEDPVANGAFWNRRRRLLAWDVGLAAVTILMIGAPLLFSPAVDNHDISHICRIVYGQDALRQGIWSWRWMPTMARGYGYPIFNYYAPGSVYLSAFFAVLTGSVAAAAGLTIIAVLALGWVGMRAWIRVRWSPETAAPAAVLYTLAPYHLLNTHVRGAMAEALALGIFPFVLWAGERALKRSLENGAPMGRAGRIVDPYIILAGVFWGLVIYSHNISAMVLGVLLCTYYFVQALAERRWSPVLTAGSILLVGAGLTAFFWIPCFAEMHAVSIERVQAGIFDYQKHFVYFHQLFDPSWGWGLSVPGPYDDMSFQVGWVHAIVWATALVLVFVPRLPLNWSQRMWGAFWICVTGLSTVLMLEISSPVWSIIPPLHILQFPWRLLGIIMLGTSALSAFVLQSVPERQRYVVGATMVFLTFLFSYRCTEVYEMKSRHLSIEGLQIMAEKTDRELRRNSILMTAGMNEYLPRGVEVFPAEAPKAGLSVGEFVTVIQYSREGNRYKLHVRAEKPSSVTINQFNFPGWRARLNGRDVQIQTVRPHGLIGVNFPAGEPQLEVWFGSTPVRRLGQFVSGVVLVGILLSLLSYLQKRRDRNVI